MTAGHELLHLDDLHLVLLVKVSEKTAGPDYATGCRRTRQPVTLKPTAGGADDPGSGAAHREQTRGRVCFRVPRPAAARKVLLLVPAVGARVARALLRRRVPQLRALALTDRAIGGGAGRRVPPGAARGPEPGRRAGRQGSDPAARSRPARRARLLPPGGHEPGAARDGGARRARRRHRGAGAQGRLHAAGPPGGARRRARDAPAAGAGHRQHAGRLRSRHRGVRRRRAAAPRRPAARRRRAVRRRRHAGGLRQSVEPPVRLGAAPRRRHPRRRRRARLRDARRPPLPRPPPHLQVLPRGSRRRGADGGGRRDAAPRGRRAARDESLLQVRREHLPADSRGRRPRRPLAGDERRRAVPDGAGGPRVTAVLEGHGVGDALRDGRALVAGVSFTVSPGETLVLLGRSGSGKTTTLKLVNRLLEPTAGEIRVAGEPTGGADPTRLRRRIGYVIQEIGLFPHFTVEQNVGLVPRLEGWAPRRIAARVRELLTLVGLAPDAFTRRHPHELSGGQRQRVGIARALAADPPLLLLDEPFGALDPITRAELQREFRALQVRLRKTAIFVTHDMREAALVGDRIAVVAGGRLRAVATPEALREGRDPAVRALVDA